MKLFYFARAGKDSTRAKVFMKQIEKGHAKGIISTWTLIEIISATRAIFARHKETNTAVIEQEVQEVLYKIYQMNNIDILSGQ